ncbi:MAG: 50S ribosomal protein L25 [Spirochaetes bacterium]|nr:MAG: 50S ribosomal protein L25 [Spirochaetota bacterium]RKX84589.1 MAG: 50S ribosomal protein L25 [Spirochaetota bacterium]RKX98937.1 MAG: 50S ribosomal protein L25 [Spirochaetota bacterium]
MDSMQLVVEKREASNKGAARELRRNGRIPAVLYGEGEPKAVSVDAREWALGFQNISGNTIVKLKIDKDEHNVLIKDTQDDILSGKVRHIDFYAIHAGKKLTTFVPVRLEGSPVGVLEGGILEHKIELIEVVCLPKDMPEVFIVDVSELNVGDSLHVGKILVPEGVEIRTDADSTLAVVTHAKAVVEEVEEEAEEGEAEEEGEEDGEEAGAEE